jgi:fucose permease
MKKNPMLLMLAVYATFFALGMPDGAFGVAWPNIRYEMGLPLERAALLIVTHSIFYSLSAWGTGRLASWFKVERISGAGFLLLIAGIMAFSFSRELWHLAAATVVLGLGMGMVDSGINAFATDRFSARHLNWLHCFWAMGGATSPIIMRQMIIYYDWNTGYRAIFAIQAVIAFFVAISMLKGLWEAKETIKPMEDESETVPCAPKVFLTAKVYQSLQWFIFFLYTAFEYSVTFWTVSVLMESRDVYFADAGLFPAVYLGALMAGRFTFGYVTEKVSGSVVIRMGLLLSISGLLVLTFTSNIAGIALVGFGFAPVFPCLMNETKNRFDPAILSRLVGSQVAAAGAGVALSAIVMGQILERISLEALFPTVIICVVVTFSMNEFIEFKLKRRKKLMTE